MNKKFLLLYVLICSVVCSCSPRIGANIMKKYPPQATDAPVAIYTRQQDLPQKWEPIGTLDIGDSGFTTNCDSATIFSIAKTETRKAGGNGLLVTRHLRPSFFGSSCHQISGTMLLVSDFSDYTQVKNDSPETITFVQAQPAEVNYRQSNQLSNFSFMFDAGYNWRTVKAAPDLSEFEKHVYEQVNDGFMYNGSFAYFFKKQFLYGIGLNFHHFGASYETYAQNLTTGQSGVLKVNDRIMYFGPAFMMQGALRESKWIFDLSLGIGYLKYVNKYNFTDENIKLTGATVGFLSQIGLSYKITPEWAIGIKLITIDGALSEYTLNKNGQITNEKYEDNQREGLAQFGISLGIRYYIKSK